MEPLHEILEVLNNDQDLNSNNIVKKIKKKLEEKSKLDSGFEGALAKEEYNVWKESKFSLDCQFTTNIASWQGTLLHVAAKHGHTNIIKILIESGADVDGKHSHTPLHAAAESNQLEAARILIKNGANVHTKDIWECTPLHYAAVSGSESIIRLLIQNGADSWVKDKNSETPVYSYVYGRAWLLSPLTITHKYKCLLHSS
ncbi:MULTISPECIES: ankyrin repeat domain-containing protein [unclassified Wolbachia]|uniref:ankyrin repeat domain-containing protein n=1 Tax=unclassified Wolbachia TaxID=2640676 RepID=UPI0031333529